jgi:outer membrane protein assembly factor BamA
LVLAGDVHRGTRKFARSWGKVLGLAIVCLLAAPLHRASAQSAPAMQTSPNATTPPASASATIAPRAQVPGLRAWEGLKVKMIEFNGVDAAALDPLPGTLALQPGMPLDGEKLRDSLRRLYATGLYQTIIVEGIRSGNELTIIFSGTPRAFIGTVNVVGIKDDRLASQLVNAAKLEAGTVFSEAKLEHGQHLIQQQLRENGYYQATLSYSTKPDPEHAQVSVSYSVILGKDARVGAVAVEGDSGMSLDTFRKKSKLKYDSKVNRDTTNRALSGLRKVYQKQKRLESDVNAQAKDYDPPVNRLNYKFGVNRGPIVTIEVEGVKVSKGTIRRLVPVYEEGAVDDDLLNEGDRNLRDYLQRAGYFNVKVTHDRKVHTAERSDIVYTVDRGLRYRVVNVSVAGNKYFDSETIASRLSVLKADIFQKNGLYSQALVNSDVDTIKALYQSNGFSDVKVTPDVTGSEKTAEGNQAKLGTVFVRYEIEEGQQQRVGKFEIVGDKQVPLSTLEPKLNTQVGQPYSAANIAGDRDEILGYYLDHGFGQAQVNATQQIDPANPSLVDIAINIQEGDEIFVRQVLISGLDHTRPKTVDQLVTVHPGDPLNQTALLDTQRALYNLALFNEVNTAVQNPDGDALRKNVLLQLTEAKRWDFNYGFGFEAQTGNPTATCLSLETLIALGIDPSTYKCSPNGKTGVSPAVLFDVTRTNVRGTNQSATLRTAYGTLEQRATLVYNFPKLFGWRKFDGSLSGGYIDSQDVTTYSSSQLSGSVRVTERPDRRNTFIYEFSYRRVKVANVQVAPNLVPLYSQPVRVGGPGVTWIRDTRDNPLDAHRGTYNTISEFFADSAFGSQANFNRIDMTNSSYYSIGKRKWVLARSTRFGMEQSFRGTALEDIPLPERLYAGGAQSHRGFAINQAGPRDDLTGYPIGGAGAFVNSLELRLPNATLPYVGNNLGFVLFHDMGNVFNSVSDIGSSILRFHQPDVAACKDTSVEPPLSGTLSSGKCSFDYFSHAVGVGLRYRTPIGPVRADFSLNLDPPYYPVFIQYYASSSVPISSPPYHTNSGYFNFFFSIGQSF